MSNTGGGLTPYERMLADISAGSHPDALEKKRMKILDFKTISPFFEQCRDGQKPFDIRLRDGKDKRFRALSQWHRASNWYIRFTNPATGEQFSRKLLRWDYIRDQKGLRVFPDWGILYLGEMPEEVR